jgi:hypothetical protein
MFDTTSLVYSVSLSTVALALGLFYILSHGFALIRFKETRALALTLPRNTAAGIVLFLCGMGWFMWLIGTIDLMEYTPNRTQFLAVIALVTVLFAIYVQEFILVRAIGIVLLMLAQVMLDAAFLRDEPSRLVITVTAYAYIVTGMFWVGSPYLMRDMIEWAYRNETRARLCAWAGVAFGIVLLFLGFFVY